MTNLAEKEDFQSMLQEDLNTYPNIGLIDEFLLMVVTVVTTGRYEGSEVPTFYCERGQIEETSFFFSVVEPKNHDVVS